MDNDIVAELLSRAAKEVELAINVKHVVTKNGKQHNTFKVLADVGNAGITSITPSMMSSESFRLNAPASISFVEKHPTQHLLRYTIDPKNLDSFTEDDARAICISMAARLDALIGEDANKPTLGRTRGTFVIPGMPGVYVLESPVDGKLEIRLWADFVVA